MRNDPFAIQKQTGKVVKPTVIGSGVSSAIAILKDTDYYQILGHNDYIQDNGSK